MSNRARYFWETVDFRVAGPGWRIVTFSDPDSAPAVTDLPGWLVQEEVLRRGDAIKPEYDLDGNRAPWGRRVVPGLLVDGGVEAADDGDGVYAVLGPTDPDLTDDDMAHFKQERRRVLDARRQAGEAARAAREAEVASSAPASPADGR